MYASSSCVSGRRIDAAGEIRFGSYALRGGSAGGAGSPFVFSLTARFRGFPFPAGDSDTPSPVVEALRFRAGAGVGLSSALTGFLRFLGLSCGAVAADLGETRPAVSRGAGMAFGDPTSCDAFPCETFGDTTRDSRSSGAGTSATLSSLTFAPPPANALNASAADISCSDAFPLNSPSRPGEEGCGVSFTVDACDEAALGVRERSAVNDFRKAVKLKSATELFQERTDAPVDASGEGFIKSANDPPEGVIFLICP